MQKEDITEYFSGLDTETMYNNLHEAIKNNPGLTLKKLGEKLKMEEKVIEHLLWCINEYPCSFHDYGPYVKKKERWYIQQTYTTILSLERENQELKEKLKDLEKRLASE